MLMRRLSPFRRILIFAIGFVQMAVPAVVAIADAQLLADSGGAPQVHIEDHTQNSCRPVHPDDCALCQLLTHVSAPRASAPVVPAAAGANGAARDCASVHPASVTRAQQRTRAPPVSLS
jgi:hypothetical protein